MQIKDCFIFTKALFLFLFLSPAVSTLAQQVTTNSSGEKIVIFDDGSWRYFNPETDAALEKTQKVNTSGRVADRVVEKDKKKKERKRKKGQKTKKSKKEKVKKTKNKQGKVKKSKKNKKPKKKKKIKKEKKGKKSKGKKIVKSEVSPEAIRQSNALAIRRADRAAAAVSKTQRILEEATLDRELLENELQEAYTSLETTDTDIAEIEGRLQSIRAKEVVAAEKHQTAEKLAKDYEKMIDMSYLKREKLLAKMDAANQPEMASNNNGEADDVNVSKAEQKRSDEMKSRRNEMNVMINPPKPPCNLIYDGLDEFSGKARKDIAKELFFSFTNEKMRPYFKNREFISCNAGLTSFSGGIYFLGLDLEIASEKAQREYGFLEKGAAIIIKFIDGGTVRLVNRKTDMGTLNPLQKSVVYKPQYVISSNQVKTLNRGEVDRVRIVWSTGYEDYEVYELDFFVNQFRCLQEK